MNVQFESPKTALDSDGDKIWKDGFDPTKSQDLNLIPDEQPGVYIVGVKLFLNGIETFFPLYVGEASDLKVRLNNHYKERSTKNSNSTKEIFDLSNILINYKDLYEALKAYNDLWIFNSIKIGGSKKKHKMYCNDKIEKFLLYFQCSSYLNFCLNSDIKTSCWKDFNHKYFYNHLILLDSPTSKKIVNTYNLTKDCVRDNFYFSYSILPNTSQAQRQVVEAQTKYYLEQLYTIYTSSDVTNNGKTEWEYLKNNNSKNTKIDFSKIDKLLIKNA